MIKTIICCDACGKELPILKKEVCGIEVEYVEVGVPKELSTSRSNCHLCRACASKIDYELLKFKTELIVNNTSIHKKGE